MTFHLIELPMLAVVGELLVVPQAKHDIEGFLKQFATVILAGGQAHILELQRLIGAADTEIQAAIADHIDHREVFGGSHRIVEIKKPPRFWTGNQGALRARIPAKDDGQSRSLFRDRIPGQHLRVFLRGIRQRHVQRGQVFREAGGVPRLPIPAAIRAGAAHLRRALCAPDKRLLGGVFPGGDYRELEDQPYPAPKLAFFSVASPSDQPLLQLR